MADAPTCPYCRRRPGVPGFAPFCSERCKLADLGQWLSGNYRVPGPPAADENPDDGDIPADSSN